MLRASVPWSPVTGQGLVQEVESDRSGVEVGRGTLNQIAPEISDRLESRAPRWGQLGAPRWGQLRHIGYVKPQLQLLNLVPA